MRPKKFTDDLASAICQRIAAGETIRKICQDGDMPTKATLYRWLASPAQAAFRDQYTVALEARAELMAEEILAIADDAANDFVEKQLKSGEITHVFDSERVQRSRLRVDARKWLLAKMLPRKYGDLAARGRARHEDEQSQDGEPVDHKQELNRKLARLADQIRTAELDRKSDER